MADDTLAINEEDWQKYNEELFASLLLDDDDDDNARLHLGHNHDNYDYDAGVTIACNCLNVSGGCRGCNKNLASQDPVSQYLRQKIIQNTVRVSSSLYSMNMGALTVYQSPNKMRVNWNQMSDRRNAHYQKSAISMRSSVSVRPGNLSPGGVGCDIKHNSYDRYLARLKGAKPLRKGNLPADYGVSYIPFNRAFPIYGGKTVKTAIGTSTCKVCIR